MAELKTDLLEKHQKVYDLLKKVRESKTVSLKPTAMLRSEIVGLDGNLQPFRLRYYQVQAIFHLLSMKRMVLGDAAGSGKTIVAIAALCYTWEKEPDNKVIIVVPKSALRQWAAEIKRFATEIKVILVDGPLEERKKVYSTFVKSTGKTVLLIGYAILVRDWNEGASYTLKANGQPDLKAPMNPGVLNKATKEIPNLSTFYDECFYYYTPVVLDSGKTELIGKIVANKKPVSVLSWNWGKNEVEAKPVINWYRKNLVYGKRAHLLTINFRLSGVVKVTPSHIFYRMDGSEVVANSLRVGQATAALDLMAPSLDQEQLILGSLLGDTSIDHHSLIWSTVHYHSTKQRAYLEFKKQVLSALGASELSYYQSEMQSGAQQIVRFRLNSNKYITSLLRQWHVIWQHKKRVNLAWLDHIGPLGLAFWYGDDGSLGKYTTSNGEQRYNIAFHTEGYSREENQLLAAWLWWKWRIKANVVPIKKRQNQKGYYYYLYLPHKESMKFFALLPGALPGVEYKFPPNTRVLTTTELDLTPRKLLVQDEVLSISKWQPSKQHQKKGQNKYVYDLEVADNHNYFANGTLVSNCTAFKNTSTKTWQVCRELSDRSNRCYGLSATLLKNNLIEGFSIYKCIYPDVFSTKTNFLNTFCVTRLQPVAGGRKIPVVVGYKNLQLFRDRIDPFFLGRPKHIISDELPKLITKEVLVKLSDAEDAKYEEALSGILALGDGEVKDYEEHKQFVALIYCQQTVDSLSLLRYEEGDEIHLDMFQEESAQVKALSSKEQALMDILTGEFEDEKVIVYTRFASLIPRLQELCKRAGIESVAITGKVVDTRSNPARQKAMVAFQDLKSKVKVIFISDAGSEAINLQAASAMIFYNAPWSWGNYVQLLGRPIRIGSPHQHVLAVHLVAERPGDTVKERKTIDHYTLEILQRKKNLIDKVLGESAVGALNFETEGSFTVELMKRLREGKKPVVV